MTDLNHLIHRDEFPAYRRLLEDHAEQRIDNQEFIGERLKLGVYAQRQEGLCMVRTKFPGGRIGPRQLRGIAQGLQQFSQTAVVHLTTRQNIQFHDIPLAQTAELLELLADHGVTSREAGGNTVRNITACPLAGVCPAECVNVDPYIARTTAHFLRHPLTQSLPRKFKMSFSGCATDCAQGLSHDLAVVARYRGEEPGFGLSVGGGLGAKPRMAVELEAFLPQAELLPAIEAVLLVHDRYSDRQRKSRSRIKFLLERFGVEEFKRLYREAFAETRAAFDTQQAPLAPWRRPQSVGEVGFPRQVVAQHQADRVSLPVAVPFGDLNIQQLRGLADLLEQFALDEARITQEQSLILPHIPQQQSNAVQTRLQALALRPPLAGDRVTACPGTATCTLGITASAKLARELNGGHSDLDIRVNGCQNSCANSELADIGLYGLARRYHGQLVPAYRLQLGGLGRQRGGFGFDGPVVPAARAAEAVARIEARFRAARGPRETFRGWSQRLGADYFTTLLGSLCEVEKEEVAELQRDHGDTEVFRVTAVGVGECAGAQARPRDKALLEAAYAQRLRDAFFAKGKHEDALQALGQALELGARALLHELAPLQAREPLALARVAQTLGTDHTTVIQLGALWRELEALGSQFDETRFPSLARASDSWLSEIKPLTDRHGRGQAVSHPLLAAMG